MNPTVEKKLETFFTSYKQQSYKKGEILIRADDEPSGIFYLKEGQMKQYIISQKGDEVTINIFRPISFFPMSWAINHTDNAYYFEALTDLVVWRAPKEATITFIKDHPDVLYDLLRRVYKGIDGLLLRMTYLMSGNASARLITELLIHAKRFGKSTPTTIEIKISEKELAAQTGMTRETISRELKILKEKKLVIRVKNNLVIINRELLKKELHIV